jgi:RNA polymerase sigma-70 factor, ECF subfamily
MFSECGTTTNTTRMCGTGFAPEAELIRLARSGDEEALRELFLTARDPCMRLAMSLLRDGDDARDELQNAFLNAYTHLASFNENSKFSTWVGRILINRCHLRIRERRRMPTVPHETMGKSTGFSVAFEQRATGTPECRLGSVEVRRLVSEELQLIPGSLRKALELRFIQELSPAETARRLNLSLSAAKSRVHRAQQCLKARMMRHCGLRGAGTLTRQI